MTAVLKEEMQADGKPGTSFGFEQGELNSSKGG